MQSAAFPSVPGSLTQRANCSRRKSGFDRYSATECCAGSGWRVQHTRLSAAAVARRAAVIVPSARCMWAWSPSSSLMPKDIVQLALVQQPDGREVSYRAHVSYGLLMCALPADQFLGLNQLEEHLQLRLVVLEHSLFRLNSSLQIQNCLLIGRSGDGPDQLLDGGEAVTRRRVSLLRGDLKQR